MVIASFYAAMQQDIIRQQAKTKLKMLSTRQRIVFSKQMTNIVLAKFDNPFIKLARNIACYWPTKYEISTIELIDNLLLSKKFCYLPVINQKNNTLDFIKYDKHTKLITNKFNISEPEFNIRNKVNLSEIDLIFMPLIAFDCIGHRIGSGSGLFDRSIGNVSCPIVGLAYSCQQFENIIPNPWDVNLNYIATEKQWINCSKSV